MNISRNPNSSPEYLKLLLDNSSVGFIAFDNNYNVTFVNKQALLQHGNTDAGKDPYNWKDYVTVMDPEGIRVISDNDLPASLALQGQIVIDRYCLLRRRDLPDILIKYNAAPLLDENKNQIGVLVTSEDSADLAHSLARFRTIFDQSPLSIQILNRTGKTLLVNKAFQNLWGFSDEFLAENILQDYNLLEDKVLIQSGNIKHIRKAFDGEAHISDPIYYDPAMAGFPGRPRWTIATMYPLKDSRGEVREVVLIHQDITEAEQNRVEKERLLAKLDAILKQMPAGVLVVNEKGGIPVYNNKMGDIVGEPQKAKEVFMPQLQTAMRGEVVKSVEVAFNHDSGDKRILSVSSGPVHDQAGNIRSSVVIATDISQRKRKESNDALLNRLKTLLLTTIKYDQIVEKIASATIPFFADGVMIDLIENDSIKRIVTKHKDPEIEKLVIRTRTEYPPHPGSPVPTMRVLETGEPLLLAKVDPEVIRRGTLDQGHFELVTKIGTKSHLAVPMASKGEIMGTINFIITDSNRPLYDELDVGVAKDIAHFASLAIENARLYKDAMSGLQLRDDFISIASHELRTPITSLNLQIEVLNSLVDELKSDSEIPIVMRKFLDSTNNQVKRLSHLVDDMLDISRISIGKLNLNIRNVKLKTLTMEVLERFDEQLKEKRIELFFDAPDNIIVECDAGRIDQVITNFMTNAIRYGKKKPILITIEDKESYVHLRIQDHGRGIRREDFERIFNRFERAHTADDVSGLGLGLYINKTIVEEHNGRILLESEPEKGSIFILELPKNQPTP